MSFEISFVTCGNTAMIVKNGYTATFYRQQLHVVHEFWNCKGLVFE